MNILDGMVRVSNVVLGGMERVFNVADSCGDASCVIRNGVEYARFVGNHGSKVKDTLQTIVEKCQSLEGIIGCKSLWYGDVKSFYDLFFRRYIDFAGIRQGFNYILISKLAGKVLQDTKGLLEFLNSWNWISLAKVSQRIASFSVYGKNIGAVLVQFLDKAVQKKCAIIVTILDFSEQCRRLAMGDFAAARFVSIAKDVFKLAGTAATTCIAMSATAGSAPLLVAAIAYGCPAINAAISLASLRWTFLG